MNGKNNYNKTKIINKINQFVKRNNNGDNVVFYCIDTDNINSDRQHFDFFKNVSNFCKANKYQLIWFCYDIENVFLKRGYDIRQAIQELVKVYDKSQEICK